MAVVRSLRPAAVPSTPPDRWVIRGAMPRLLAPRPPKYGERAYAPPPSSPIPPAGEERSGIRVKGDLAPAEMTIADLAVEDR